VAAGGDAATRREAQAGRSAAQPSGITLALVATVLGAIGVAWLVGVRGDFPLSDDWSYAFAVRSMCGTGLLQMLPWTGASLVLQAGYGAALCRTFGFSFEVLRLSTVVLAASGAGAFVLLQRALGLRGGALLLGTLLFALNPLFVNLAFTFMTDVPFVVAATWAGYAYALGLGERSARRVFLGSLAASAAFLIRQHGIFVALAGAATALLDRERPLGPRLRLAATALVLPALTFVLFHLWLFDVQGVPSGYTNKLSEAHRVTAVGLVNCAFRGLEYLGLFVAPLALALPLRGPLRRGALAATALLAALAGALYLREGTLMFSLTNVLYDLGLGPLSLRDTLFLGEPPTVHVGRWLQIPLTAVAVGAGGVMAAAWAAAVLRPRSPGHAFVALAALFLFASSLLHTRYYFDRYLLAVVPFLVATLAASDRLRRLPLAVALACVLGWYAVAGTHDYLAWNRARWDALDRLTITGTPATAIDGGMEFNAWLLAPTLNRWPSDEDVRPGQPDDRHSWWWVVDDRYVVAFRPLRGYHVREELPFTRWLVPAFDRLFLLERDR
jgi:hypothetical protein